jgi:hypothetical protein
MDQDVLATRQGTYDQIPTGHLVRDSMQSGRGFFDLIQDESVRDEYVVGNFRKVNMDDRSRQVQLEYW